MYVDHDAAINQLLRDLAEAEINARRLRARLAEVEAERDARPTWGQHRIWRDALRRENERRKAFETEAREYRNAICWDTTCLACSKVLDSAYAETVRAEKAEARLAEVEAERDACERQAIDAEKACTAAEREARESKQDIESLAGDLSAVRIERDHFKARLAAVVEVCRGAGWDEMDNMEIELWLDMMLSAAMRGEGARPAECCKGSGVGPHRFDPDDWNGTANTCGHCNHVEDHPIHSGEGDR